MELMADFMQAIKWMKEGKNVRMRHISNKKWYIYVSKRQGEKDFVYLHYNIELEDKNYRFNLCSLEATDWEIYRKETSSEFLKRAGTDGTLWAKEFMKLFEDKKDKIDESLMIGWFCNAIEAGKSAT